MRILGIDPGLQVTGFGVVDSERTDVKYEKFRGHLLDRALQGEVDIRTGALAAKGAGAVEDGRRNAGMSGQHLANRLQGVCRQAVVRGHACGSSRAPSTCSSARSSG